MSVDEATRRRGDAAGLPGRFGFGRGDQRRRRAPRGAFADDAVRPSSARGGGGGVVGDANRCGFDDGGGASSSRSRWTPHHFTAHQSTPPPTTCEAHAVEKNRRKRFHIDYGLRLLRLRCVAQPNARGAGESVRLRRACGEIDPKHLLLVVVARRGGESQKAAGRGGREAREVVSTGRRRRQAKGQGQGAGRRGKKE